LGYFLAATAESGTGRDQRHFKSIGSSEQMEASAPIQMLDGYKVLDFTQAVAGPTATLMLAEMGAEVIKVELMPNGDLTRAIPLIKNGAAGILYSTIAARKASVWT
jgi:crotonobetainyl-CoA:carnitine CoA-transferase CaiB-like acyl-CoA transferase